MDETNQLHDLKKQINIRLSAAKIRFTQSSLECSVVTYTWDSKNVLKNLCLFKQTPIPAKVMFYIISRALSHV